MNDHLLMMVEEIPHGNPWKSYLYVGDTPQQLILDCMEFVKYIIDKFGSDIISRHTSRVVNTQGGRFIFVTNEILRCTIKGTSFSKVFWHSSTPWNPVSDVLLPALVQTKGTIV